MSYFLLVLCRALATLPLRGMTNSQTFAEAGACGRRRCRFLYFPHEISDPPLRLARACLLLRLLDFGSANAPLFPPQFCSGILNAFLPDVFITTDHNKGAEAGASPGYGVALVATTTSGCAFGAQRASGRAPGISLSSASSSSSAATSPDPPEDLGAEAAGLLLDEIARGGCIDTCAQPLAFTFMVLGPADVSRLRVGRLGPAGVATLRLIKEFFGVVFLLTPDVQKVQGPPAGAAAAREEGGGNEGGADDNAQSADKLEGRKRRRNDAIAGAHAKSSAAAAAAMLTLGVSGGHSGATVLVSCQGIGFRNFAKKVT